MTSAAETMKEIRTRRAIRSLCRAHDYACRLGDRELAIAIRGRIAARCSTADDTGEPGASNLLKAVTPLSHET